MCAPTVRVVVVESTEPSLPFVRELLATLADEVVSASVGRLGAHRHIDLIVLARGAWTDSDTVLCGTIYAEGAGVPLIAISGATPLSHRAAALRAGADEFIEIPFEVDDLAARVFALTRLSARATPRVGAFTVDSARRKVLVDGQ